MQRNLRSAALLVGVGLALSGQTPPTTPSKPQPAPCAAAEFSQFDFWVGYWDVYDPKGNKVANSLIEKVYGCGVRENWKPFTKNDGGSLNIYVPASKGWEQFWIDSGGTRARFTGGWNGTAMVLTGEWAGPVTRMTYTPNADGSVRQFGEQSTDNGKTWAPSFDFVYRPHKGS